MRSTNLNPVVLSPNDGSQRDRETETQRERDRDTQTERDRQTDRERQRDIKLFSNISLSLFFSKREVPQNLSLNLWP